MTFSDIHMHALHGVDDGAKTETEMYRMVEAAYKSGTRRICLTPHFHLGYFGDNREGVNGAYESLYAHVKNQYQDLELMLGNELRYSRDCLSWLQEGLCRTMGDTRYLLVDFSERAETKTISGGLERLLGAGYIPILAHAERYLKLSGNLRDLMEFRRNGVLIQIDSQSVLGGFGMQVKHRGRKILRHRLADFVGSDAHDLKHRPPEMLECYQWIAEKCGEDYAAMVCSGNAMKLFFDTATQE